MYRHTDYVTDKYILFFKIDIIIETPDLNTWVCLGFGARYSSVIEHSLMMRWVVGSIIHVGLIELFLVPASVPQLV